MIGKQEKSNDYVIKREDLPDNTSIISRDHIYLPKDLKPLKDFFKPLKDSDVN